VTIVRVAAAKDRFSLAGERRQEVEDMGGERRRMGRCATRAHAWSSQKTPAPPLVRYHWTLQAPEGRE
jgi:hypothetical protein